MASESVLITGAAGFIGSHLTERCLELGWRVTALDSFTEYYDPGLKRLNLERAAIHPSCSVVEGDLLALDLRPLLEDITVVFHLAAQPGVRASWDDFDLYARSNISATQRLLHAARDSPIKRFVLASSSSVYGDAAALPTREDTGLRPVSPYGVTKVACEHLAHVYWRNFGVPTVSLRYFTVYGPRQRPDMAFRRLITQALNGEPFAIYGDGQQTRDFTFVDDAVSATVCAAQRGEPGTPYNVGGGSRRSMNSVLETLGAIVGTEIKRHYDDRQLGDARDTAADIDRARAHLGFTPSRDFETGLRAQLEWQRAYQMRPQVVS